MHLSDIESSIDLRSSSYIEREGNGSTVVLSQGDFSWDSTMEDVTPERTNPVDHVYRKRFTQSKVYLPHERDEAYKSEMGITLENFSRRTSFILSMVGYSSLKKDPELGGVTTAQYEEVARKLFEVVTENIKKQYPELELQSIDGASDMGIDRPLLEYRLQNGIRGLSFSCPEYIRYVNDSGSPIFISTDADIYLKQFAMLADVMIVFGGRDAAFWKNYLVSEFAYPLGHKIAPVADPIATLSSRGDLPYFVPNNPFSPTKILNASKAIMKKNGILIDKDVDSLMSRISGEIIQFIKCTKSHIYP